MKVKSYAKINLALDILDKSGPYHKIQTIFHQIPLYDEIIFSDSNKIEIECNDPKVPLDNSNTIYKALKLLGLTKHVKIIKNIPVASGLGGGSSNAAATLKAFGGAKHASKIGMDVPFFLEGGTALGTNYGEVIKSIPPAKLPPLIIAMDDGKISTEKMYDIIDTKITGKQTYLTEKLLKNPSQPQFFHNDFDTINGYTEPLRKKLLRSGADVVHTCGSGPATYVLYPNERVRDLAFKKLKRQTKFIFIS